jgi:diguanylate cyclase (GGDEF)-like protein
VLKRIIRLARSCLRSNDTVARWGGEEFIVFLPETGQEAARALAERLRTEFSETPVAHEGGATRVTASFGIAEKADHHLTLDALIAAADECLYRSKQDGRNRVTCAATGMLPPAASAPATGQAT